METILKAASTTSSRTWLESWPRAAESDSMASQTCGWWGLVGSGDAGQTGDGAGLPIGDFAIFSFVLRLSTHLFEGVLQRA